MANRWDSAVRLPSGLLADVAWAKFDESTQSELSLAQHLVDAAEVAGYLWRHWIPEHIKERVASAAGGDAAGGALVSWLAGVHDCGKLSPAFAHQIAARGGGAVLARMRDVGLAYRGQPPTPSQAPHSTLGQLAPVSYTHLTLPTKRIV